MKRLLGACLAGALVLAALVVALVLPAAEAVDSVPPLAAKVSLPVRAAGRIGFVAGGQIMEWADGAARPLTKPGVRYEGAAWSPDGTQIAASEVGENHSDLLVLDADGAKLRQLTDNWSKVSVQDSAWARKPTWSPDGATIVFVSDLYRTDMSLWQAKPRVAGAISRYFPMAKGSGGVDWPSFSPDGKKIAVVSYPSGVYVPPQIWVYTPASGAFVQVTELKDGAFDPAWSPDGTTIAFAGRVDGKTRVMTMKADGTGLVRITDGKADRAPAWSPDGTEIAYLSLGGGSFDVWAERVTSSGVSEPKQLTAGVNADAVSGLSWAPAAP